MKSLRLLLTIALACAAPLLAQPFAPPAYPPQSPEQLEILVSPIALYPDPLISVILPASTATGDVVLAARFVRANPDPAAVDAQRWDESVRAVAHYPDLVIWMDENLEWTQQLGAAFLDQPADVMNTIQRLRANARAAGILVDTPQQRVIVQQEYVYIVPAQPDIIYIPTYDPQIFYSSRYGYPPPRSSISFSISFSTGPWLAYEPDWGRRSIWIDRRRDWSRRDWRPAPPTTVVVNAERQQWRPTVDVSTRQRVTTNTTINNTTINNNAAPNTNAAPAPRVEVARPAPFTATRENRDGGRRRESNASTTTSAAPQPPPPASEPALAPTGRTPEARAERSPRTEASTPPPAPAPTPRADNNRNRPDAPARVVPTAPPPAAPEERAERNRDNSRDRRDPPSVESRIERKATPPAPRPPVPAPAATPPTKNAPPPPPQAQPTQPQPKGKAKGKDKDDDEEDDAKKRRRDD